MSKMRFIPLGGAGIVTKNMFVYEYYPDQGNPEILIVDCGIGFPSSQMYGVDFIIPDASYLRDKINFIKGNKQMHILFACIAYLMTI